MRELGVRTKLNALTRNVRGKRLILVDDSIVRGTTSRKIVEMLRTAGAKEVHMRISSPSVLNPCYFGIDTATSEELIGHSRSVEEICRFIGADSLKFLSLPDLLKTVAGSGCQFCTGCFDGDYPIDPETGEMHGWRKNMITYKDAGVDVERGYEAVRRMKQHVAATFDENVLGGLGSFGGFYSIENENVEKAGARRGYGRRGYQAQAGVPDGQARHGGHRLRGDVRQRCGVSGRKAADFPDYIATGYLDPVKVEQIVAGVADGCRQAGCALIGGETAEMPDFYPEGEYDLAGFTVGLVGREKSISGERVAEGDVLVGMASSGVHSNGYSLVRKLVLTADRDLNAPVEAFGGKSWGETLLTPTKIYVKPRWRPARPATYTALRTSPAAALSKTFRASCPTA